MENTTNVEEARLLQMQLDIEALKRRVKSLEEQLKEVNQSSAVYAGPPLIKG